MDLESAVQVPKNTTKDQMVERLTHKMLELKFQHSNNYTVPKEYMDNITADSERIMNFIFANVENFPTLDEKFINLGNDYFNLDRAEKQDFRPVLKAAVEVYKSTNNYSGTIEEAPKMDSFELMKTKLAEQILKLMVSSLPAHADPKVILGYDAEQFHFGNLDQMTLDELPEKIKQDYLDLAEITFTIIQENKQSKMFMDPTELANQVYILNGLYQAAHADTAFKFEKRAFYEGLLTRALLIYDTTKDSDEAEESDWLAEDDARWSQWSRPNKLKNPEPEIQKPAVETKPQIENWSIPAHAPADLKFEDVFSEELPEQTDIPSGPISPVYENWSAPARNNPNVVEEDTGRNSIADDLLKLSVVPVEKVFEAARNLNNKSAMPRRQFLRGLVTTLAISAVAVPVVLDSLQKKPQEILPPVATEPPHRLPIPEPLPVPIKELSPKEILDHRAEQLNKMINENIKFKREIIDRSDKFLAYDIKFQNEAKRAEEESLVQAIIDYNGSLGDMVLALEVCQTQKAREVAFEFIENKIQSGELSHTEIINGKQNEMGIGILSELENNWCNERGIQAYMLSICKFVRPIVVEMVKHMNRDTFILLSDDQVRNVPADELVPSSFEMAYMAMKETIGLTYIGSGSAVDQLRKSFANQYVELEEVAKISEKNSGLKVHKHWRKIVGSEASPDDDSGGATVWQFMPRNFLYFMNEYTRLNEVVFKNKLPKAMMFDPFASTIMAFLYIVSRGYRRGNKLAQAMAWIGWNPSNKEFGLNSILDSNGDPIPDRFGRGLRTVDPSRGVEEARISGYNLVGQRVA